MNLAHMKWNIVKNSALVATLIVVYPLIKKEFAAVDNVQTLNTLLLFVGLIIVAPLFAAFQFSYQFSLPKNNVNLFISHLATFLAMLVIGLLAIMIDVIFIRLVGNLYSFRITILLFILCLIAWDFWDFWRLEHQKK